MAEFALGLTKTAVEGTVSRVKSAIDEEAKLKVRVQNDLVFITGEFQMMQSFLNVANKERAKNEVVRSWVRQIRNLAFDVEDCVELVVSLDVKSGWSWLWRLLPGCVAPPRPLDQAVTEIQQLKARVEDVSHRNTRYNLISDSGSDSTSSKHALVRNISSMAPELIPANDVASASSSTFQILLEVWEAAGKMQRDKGDLRKLLANEGSDLEVISLWGSPAADLGTTSILRTVYNDPKICEDFKIRAWVKLMHPFSPHKFLKRLLTQLCANSHRANVLGPELRAEMRAAVSRQDDLMKAGQLVQQVCFEHRYLAIVEQLSTVEEWEAIGMYLPDCKNGSRIVVVTQQLGLALSCTRNPYQVSELRQFTYGQSLCAFFNKKGYSDRNKSPAISSRMVEAGDWVTKLELIGRQGEQSRLHNRLFVGVKVASVWGVAGVGKSALVRSTYQLTKYGFLFDENTKHSWVDVPQSFNLTDFSRRVLMDIHSADLETKESMIIDLMEGQDPIQLCREFLQQDKCIVVIDGLRSKDDWDLIKAAFLAKRIEGHILVITNEESIALHCVDSKDDVINVKGLEDDAALNLFTKIAWGSKPLSPGEVEVSKFTVAKCGGLPKVITAIGQYCSGFAIGRLLQLERINADFMGNLEMDPGFDNLKGLFSWMQSYFDACSDSLKPCIFYLSVFPADHKSIRPRRLVRRWIAEGYSRDKIGSTAEEDGENLFLELVELSLIQHSLHKVDKVCQVNGFFREYIISRPMEDNLVFALEGRCSPNSQQAGQHLTVSSSWDRDKIVYESIDFTRLRSLTVFGKWMSFFVSDYMRLLRVLDLEDTSGLTNDDLDQIGKLLHRLKFLSLRGCREITRLPDSLFEMRQLQTLDLKHTSIVTLPANITKLKRLRYICAGSTVPSIGEAEDATVAAAAAAPPEANSDCMAPSLSAAVHDTSTPEADGDGMVPSVPTSATPPPDQDSDAPESWSRRTRGIVSTWFSNVNKLCRCQPEIKNGGVEFVPAAARGVGKLTALHTLGIINVRGAGGKLVFRELKKLTQLRKLRLSNINQKNWQDLCCAISGHGYLESLKVQLDDNKKKQDLCCLDDISEPPKTLKSLKLYRGNVHVSLAWIKQLDNLKKVRLQDVELIVSTQEDIESLMELPCKTMSRRIRIKLIQDGVLRYGRLDNWWGVNEFKAAKILKIDCGCYRSEIVFGDWIPEYVEVLVVHCSTTDASLELSRLDELYCLREVWLKGSYSEAVKQHLQDEVAKHPKKPVLKLEDQPCPS
ncbi:hypothetical protein ACQ4PT_026418 [Festuca glaucescens]